MWLRRIWIIIGLVVAAISCAATAEAALIDMHAHALPADGRVRRPSTSALMPKRDVRLGPEAFFAQTFKTEPACAHPIVSPLSDAALQAQSLAAFKRVYIVAVTSGPPEIVKAWRKAAPERIIPRSTSTWPTCRPSKTCARCTVT